MEPALTRLMLSLMNAERFASSSASIICCTEVPEGVTGSAIVNSVSPRVTVISSGASPPDAAGARASEGSVSPSSETTSPPSAPAAPARRRSSPPRVVADLDAVADQLDLEQLVRGGRAARGVPGRPRGPLGRRVGVGRVEIGQRDDVAAVVRGAARQPVERDDVAADVRAAEERLVGELVVARVRVCIGSISLVRVRRGSCRREPTGRRPLSQDAGSPAASYSWWKRSTARAAPPVELVVATCRIASPSCTSGSRVMPISTPEQSLLIVLLGVAEGVGDVAEDVPRRDDPAERHGEPEDAALGRPHPDARVRHPRLLTLRPRPSRGASMPRWRITRSVPLQARPDRDLVEAQRLAGLVEQQRQRPDRVAQVPGRVWESTMIGGPKASASSRSSGLQLQIDAHLRQVVAPASGGVQIDPVGAVRDDLADERVGEPRGHRAPVGARERAVQVAPIRQVARLGDEAVHVDHRHAEQRAGQPRSVPWRAEQAADDLDAVDLVAVHGRGDEQARARAARPWITCTGIDTVACV